MATYGTITTDTHETKWAIDGDVVDEPTSEVRGFDVLELEWAVDRETADLHLRPLEGPAGQIEVLPLANGSYDVVDKTGGDALFPLAGPTNRDALHPPGWYYIQEYDEEILDEAGERIEITTTFVPATPEQ